MLNSTEIYPFLIIFNVLSIIRRIPNFFPLFILLHEEDHLLRDSHIIVKIVPLRLENKLQMNYNFIINNLLMLIHIFKIYSILKIHHAIVMDQIVFFSRKGLDLLLLGHQIIIIESKIMIIQRMVIQIKIPFKLMSIILWIKLTTTKIIWSMT